MKKFISVLLLFTLIFSLASCNFKKSSSTELICSACGEENDQGSKFCFRCGNPFPANDGTGTGAPICSSCGTENESGSAFCANCGNALSSNSENANSGENVNGGGNENSGGNTVTDPSKDEVSKTIWVLVREVRESVTYVYSYDRKGREIKQIVYSPGDSSTPKYGYVSKYNSDGLLESYTYQAASEIQNLTAAFTHEYTFTCIDIDPAFAFEFMSAQDPSYIYEYEFVTTPTGKQVSKRTTKDRDSNTPTEYLLYSYDNNGLLKEIEHRDKNYVVSYKELYKDGIIHQQCTPEGIVLRQYVYDDNGFLIKEQTMESNGSIINELIHSHDAHGNIISSKWANSDDIVVSYEYMTLENYLANNPQ